MLRLCVVALAILDVVREKEKERGCTFLTTGDRTGRCLFLEDLYVDEDSRKSGVGRELFMAVVRLAAERDAARLQWQVLGWNQSAVEFYKRFGAELTDEWLNGKLVREQLHKLALDSK